MDLVFAMEDMERGLQEMAQSVEHMQEMLKRSPMVQALAQHKPEVRARSALLRDQENMTFFLHKASRGYPVQQVSSAPSFLRTGCLHEFGNPTIIGKYSREGTLDW